MARFFVTLSNKICRNWLIFKKILHQTAALGLLVMICFSGKPQSWDHPIVPILVVYISLIFISQQTIHSRWCWLWHFEILYFFALLDSLISLPSFNSPPAFIIRTSTRMEASVWIFWRISGARRSRYRKSFSPSLPCLPIPIQVFWICTLHMKVVLIFLCRRWSPCAWNRSNLQNGPREVHYNSQRMDAQVRHVIRHY